MAWLKSLQLEAQPGILSALMFLEVFSKCVANRAIDDLGLSRAHSGLAAVVAASAPMNTISLRYLCTLSSKVLHSDRVADRAIVLSRLL